LTLLVEGDFGGVGGGGRQTKRGAKGGRHGPFSGAGGGGGGRGGGAGGGGVEGGFQGFSGFFPLRGAVLSLFFFSSSVGCWGFLRGGGRCRGGPQEKKKKTRFSGGKKGRADRPGHNRGGVRRGPLAWGWGFLRGHETPQVRDRGFRVMGRFQTRSQGGVPRTKTGKGLRGASGGGQGGAARASGVSPGQWTPNPSGGLKTQKCWGGTRPPEGGKNFGRVQGGPVRSTRGEKKKGAGGGQGFPGKGA